MTLTIVNVILGGYFLPLVLTYISARYYYANTTHPWAMPSATSVFFTVAPGFNIAGLIYFGEEALSLYFETRERKRLEENRLNIGQRFFRTGGPKK